jgi:L-gulonolactone oxidase
VTVPGGTTLAELNAVLAGVGLALPNLGDVDAQTVAGATATGTHGTGAAHGCLSTFVTALTLVTGTGEVVTCSADGHPDVFAAARVSLGAVGVVTSLTLQCSDAFVLAAHERPGRLADVLGSWESLVAEHDHVDVYWHPYTDRVQVKTNDRVAVDDRPLPFWRRWLDDELLSNSAYGVVRRVGRAVPALVPSINELSARALTERRYTGRSDAVFCSPRRVRFVEMEYALPRAALPAVLGELPALVARMDDRVQFPVEIRCTAADDIWLSHGHGRDSAYVAVHQYAGAPYAAYFRGFAELARAHGGRPHWGKLHEETADTLRPAYPCWDAFQSVRDRLDPERVFTNRHIARVLGP